MSDLRDGLSQAARARFQAIDDRRGGRRLRDDYVARSDEEEAELDVIFAQLFPETDPLAQRVLKYLEGITRNRVLGPDTTDAQLRHMEGARWLYGIIDRRIARGRAGPRKGTRK